MSSPQPIATTERDKTGASRPSGLAPWLIPPARGWRRKSPNLFVGALARPLATLLGALLGLAGLGLAAAATHAQLSPSWLYGLVGVLVAVGLAAAWLITVRIREHLLEPLAHMRHWATHMRGGNLAARIPLPARGEFRELAQDVNRLGEELQRLAGEMNAQVRAQRLRLARKTQLLDVLYDVASSLSRPGPLESLLESFLDTFIELVDARAATVRLATENGQTRLVASRGLDAAVIERDMLMDTAKCQCGWVTTGGGIRIQRGTHQCARLIGRPMLSHDCIEFVVVPIQYQDRILGVYNLFLDRPLSLLGDDVNDLLISVGRHLGLAIEKARLDANARRLAIMEERNIIGNELHDSLAQSLVGMRLQIKMLGETLHKRDVRAAQNEVRRLRQAAEEAHASLRELLANFRFRIDDRGFVPAITNLVDRFQDETGISVFFQNECPGLSLSAAQEIQVFRIIQEALANVRKHSHAHNVRILLDRAGDARHSVLIEDDGFGIALEPDGLPGEHVGLSIMHDRAARLPGELTIESEPGEGTRVLLTFTVTPEAPPTQAHAVGG